MQTTVHRAKPATVRRGEARSKILDAAQELIIAHGVNGVSIRAINASAGVSPSILHYHFGSMEGLIATLIDRHMKPLMESRRRLLEERLAQPSLSTRDVAEIMALPLATLAIEDGKSGLNYVRFLARLYGDRSPLLEEATERWGGDISEQQFSLLQSLNPQVDSNILLLRMGLASHTLLRGLEELHREPHSWQVRRGMSPLKPWDQVSQVLNFMVAGLTGAAG